MNGHTFTNEAQATPEVYRDFEAGYNREYEVERIIASEVIMPMIHWILAADRRGTLNKEAIMARLVSWAWIIDPSITGGRSLRKLAEEIGVAKSNLARAADNVREQLNIANASTGDLSLAASKCAAKFRAAAPAPRIHAKELSRVMSA